MKNRIRFDEAPQKWAVCLQEDCPMAATCQRKLFGQLMPADTEEHNIVLPVARNGGNRCTKYVETRTYTMAWGMMHLFDEVKDYEKTPIRQKVMELFGNRMQFYRYRRALRPVDPDMQQRIAEVFRNFGYTQPLQFDRTTEEFLFPD